MAFNWKAFATGFLSDQAEQMEKRRLLNEKYKEQMEEEYRVARNTYSKRKAVVGQTMNEVAKLRSLGASDQHIKAAVASGPEAVFKLSTALGKASGKMGGTKLSHAQVDAYISGADLFEEHDAGVREFVESSYGLGRTQEDDVPYEQPNIFERAFGVNLKEGTRARLDQEKAYDGLSKMDVIELSRQEAYQSLMPGSFLTLDSAVLYDPFEVNKSFSSFVKSEIKAVQDTQAYRAETDIDKKREMTEAAAYDAALMYQGRYGDQFVENLPVGLQSLMGNKYDVLKASSNTPENSDVVQATRVAIGNELGNSVETEKVKAVFAPDGTVLSMSILDPRTKNFIPVEPSQYEQQMSKAEAMGFIVRPPRERLYSMSVTGLGPEGLFGPDVTVEALTPEGAMTAEEITQATEKALQYPTAASRAQENIENQQALRSAMADYTLEEWEGMSRKERKEKGLPVRNLDLAFAGKDAFKKFPDPTEEDIAISDATMPAEEKAEVGRVVDAWSAYIAERGITDPEEMIKSWRETATKNKLPKMYIDQVEKRLKESLGING
jgi:hypothetical protein